MRGIWIRATAVALACCCALALGVAAARAASPAPAPNATTASPLAQAQSLYDAARFFEAAGALRSSLATGRITGNDVVAARALLARCLVKAGNRLEAKQAFKTVLRLDPGYRPDPNVIPPDEVQVYQLAQAEVQREQIEAGQRVPASIAFFYGAGSGDNTSFGEFIQKQGGPSKMDNTAMFGGGVRFPLKPKFSLDLEVMRLRATAKDTSKVDYESSTIPIVASVVYAMKSAPTLRLNVFVGIGEMVSAKLIEKIDFGGGGANLAVFDEKTGFYAHGGLEGEWLPSPKLAVTARVLGRSAAVSGYFDTPGVEATLKDRKLDFSGFAATIGLRAYIGY